MLTAQPRCPRPTGAFTAIGALNAASPASIDHDLAELGLALPSGFGAHAVVRGDRPRIQRADPDGPWRANQLAAFIEAHEPDVYISAPYFLSKQLANQMPTKEDMAVALACAEKWGKLTGRRGMAVPTIDDPLAGWLDGDHHGYSRGRSR